MKTISFGSTGETVSRMCLGTMMFGRRCDEREADAILGLALDRGVTFLDTAAMYENGETEAILGRILAGRRDRFFITTKVHRSVDGATIRASIDESLARLRTDHVDLYMIHWPATGMRPAEMMEALNDVVAAGKARFVGFCNCPAWLFAHCNRIAAENGWAPLVCNQLPYNLLERGIEVEILPQAVAEGVAITTYRALLAGLLAGKYRPGEPLPSDARGQTDARIGDWLSRYGEGVAKLHAMAAEMGVQPGHLATAWVYGREGVSTPIVGVSSLEQLRSAIDGFELELAAEQRDRLSSFFGAEVKEEAGGRFPELRRSFELVSPRPAE
ncbi:aldo/keto reductase [Aureimonas leprariae]|uniref:Aldo/keto reductase n=1 Tax=Plantimonas leprariae TaxID=2615207 RepID=A0A7V7TVE4_9HYPH|nr:aldo/keto reductase [Aureimonas leprariae]KAB0677405.1 aldo/keto reductase [Aureimonas leprariae]